MIENNNIINIDEWYTHEEAAEATGRTSAGIRDAIKSGNMQERIIFNRHVIHITELQKYLDKIHSGVIRRGPKCKS